MRKKSTKSLTFSTWRGIQITKDRVVDITNPQSGSQMAQRLKLPVVAQARTQLRGLVNHSWQGVDYGYKSLYKFSSENLRKGNLNIIEYVPKGAMLMGLADYVVSQGSLPKNEVGMSNEAQSLLYTSAAGTNAVYNPTDFADVFSVPIFRTPNAGDITITVKGGTPTKEEYLEFFLKALTEDYTTDQISFLGLLCKDQYRYNTTSAEQSGTAQYELFPRYTPVLYRLVNGMKESALDKITFGSSTDTWGNDDDVFVFMNLGEDLQIVAKAHTTLGSDSTRSLTLSKDAFTNKVADDLKAEGDVSGYYYGATPASVMSTGDFYIVPQKTGILLGGVSVISSRKVDSSWRRSSQRVVVCCPDVYSADDVINSYLKTSASSGKFLNNGDESTNITGNSGSSTSSTDDDEKSQG